MIRLGLPRLAVLAMASCGYSTYYPHPVGFIDDTGSGQAQAPCGFAGPTAVELTLTPSIPEPQQVFEVDPTSCVEVYHAELQPNDVAVYPTWSGVTWGSRGPGGELLGFFSVPDGVSDWSEYVP